MPGNLSGRRREASRLYNKDLLFNLTNIPVDSRPYRLMVHVGANCIRPIMIQMHFPNWVQWHPIFRITGVIAG